MHDVALIGAGRIGKIHATNVLAHPRLRLKYVIDPFTEAREAIAKSTGALSSSLEHALDDADIKGVIVASSTDTHLDYSLRAIDAGKAVFCEKPVDLDLARARSAQAILGPTGVPLLVAFNRRFDPHFARVHARLISGEMGTLETLHIISHDPAPPPIEYVRASGGLFRDMTIHDFDMARWLLGEEPVEIYAAGSCLVDHAIGEAGDIDTAKILLRTASGKICVISNTRRSGYGYDQRIEACCSNGLIRADNVHETTVETWQEQGSSGAPIQSFFLERYAEAYRREIAHFADLIDGSTEPLVGFNDGVAALALAEAAALSMRSGQPERV